MQLLLLTPTVTGASFYPLPDCSESKRTSNFSTFCISNKSVSIDKKSQGIFIVTMDPCSIPYSYNVLAYFPSKNIEVVNRYTAPKTNSFVPVGEFELDNLGLGVMFC